MAQADAMRNATVKGNLQKSPANSEPTRYTIMNTKNGESASKSL